jgi:hypothetical protein
MLWPHFVSLKWSLLPGQGVNADKVQRDLIMRERPEIEEI